MISVRFTRDGDGRLRSFTAKNHGKSSACAAVSLFVLNTVNCVEALTDEKFSCDYEEEGGFIRFSLSEPPRDGARLLLETLLYGLKSVKEQYPTEIDVKD